MHGSMRQATNRRQFCPRDVDEGEKEEHLCGHSEKVAIFMG